MGSPRSAGGELPEKENNWLNNWDRAAIGSPCPLPRKSLLQEDELSGSLFLILDPADRDPALGGGGG